eukprot:CAMPEP_0206152602 /NCGR_PEP_ID=MMETSP1473-20131121/39407_1 /ASSEMBLY_ACC=CAM_ASM_001109 /TAXON_ID=1461547 /ORGANISM="Stichococcus sp, Strain RCC1054" /LENGTH=841 /DNA_ID=CAMNT_0053550163 /DNA_START=304 /DNA_END=2829 /DNA_ORIENTATION=+
MMDGAGTVQFSAACFEDFKPIGVGKESTIYSAQCSKLGGATVAIKVYLKNRTTTSKLRAIKREAQLMQYMLKKCVASVTKFYGAFQDEERICIVMEYCPRGDLLELLLAENRAFSEERVAQVALSLLQTFQHMHALHLIHRDVKLENIFIGAAGELKLGDFGLTMSTQQESAISPVGTTEYMAPEVVRLPRVELVTSRKVDVASLTPCTSAVDIWALGITLYELLSGHLPYEKHDKATMRQAILKAELRPLPSSVSPQARHFLSLMLQPEVSRRATASQLLQHPFLTARAPEFCGSPRSVLPPIADAAAYIEQPQATPWATKGGTSCIEVPPPQRVKGPAQLSIPETPEQLRSPCATRAPRQHLVPPVMFWNAGAETPEAAPEGPLICASFAAEGLATPGFPSRSPAKGRQPQHSPSHLRPSSLSPVAVPSALKLSPPAGAWPLAASSPSLSPSPSPEHACWSPTSSGSRTPPQHRERSSPSSCGKRHHPTAGGASSPLTVPGFQGASPGGVLSPRGSALSPRGVTTPLFQSGERPSSPMRQRLELHAAGQIPGVRSRSPVRGAPGGARRMTPPPASPPALLLSQPRPPPPPPPGGGGPPSPRARAHQGAEQRLSAAAALLQLERQRPVSCPARLSLASSAEPDEQQEDTRPEDRMPATRLKTCGSSGLLSPYAPAALGDAAAAAEAASEALAESNPFSPASPATARFGVSPAARPPSPASSGMGTESPSPSLSGKAGTLSRGGGVGGRAEGFTPVTADGSSGSFRQAHRGVSSPGAGLSIATSSWPGQHSDGEEAGGDAGALSWRTGARAQSEPPPWSPARLLQRLSSLLGSSSPVAAAG